MLVLHWSTKMLVMAIPRMATVMGPIERKKPRYLQRHV